MKKPIVIEHNATTGEVIEREMTEQEIAISEEIDSVIQAEREAAAAKAEAKSALLAKLGITEDEAKLLLS